MDQEKPPSLRGLITRIGCTLVGLLLLYVLSIGPSYYILTHTERLDTQLFYNIYAPLWWATSGTPVESSLETYSEWWINLH